MVEAPIIPLSDLLPDHLVTIGEAAELAGIKKQTLSNYFCRRKRGVAQYKVPTAFGRVRCGRGFNVLFERVEVERWIAERCNDGE